MLLGFTLVDLYLISTISSLPTCIDYKRNFEPVFNIRPFICKLKLFEPNIILRQLEFKHPHRPSVAHSIGHTRGPRTQHIFHALGTKTSTFPELSIRKISAERAYSRQNANPVFQSVGWVVPLFLLLPWLVVVVAAKFK